MIPRLIPAQALTPTLLRYLASGLTREPYADLVIGFGMPEDTIRLRDPDVVLSVTCVCPPMFRASVMKLARTISRDVALVRCCQTILDPLPVAIDVVLASGGHPVGTVVHDCRRRCHAVWSLGPPARAGGTIAVWQPPFDELGSRTMRTDFDHLTLAKRQELARVVMILVEEFDRSLAGRKAPHALSAKLLKIVLFGSYARGDQVVDPVGGYFSDFDVLVVVNHEELADVTEYWRTAEDRLLRELEAGAGVRTPVNLIVHSMADLNARLRRGRPFFVDIVRDGILLLDTPGYPFDPPKPLSVEAARAEARGHFEEWFSTAGSFLRNAGYARDDQDSKLAAFLLHQATERLYHCTLLVLTLYSPKSHKLNFLRGQAERLAPALIPAWPRDTRFAQRCFELLRRAYVDARYSPHYRISAEELGWLVEHVTTLQELVERTCEEYLDTVPS